MERPNQVSLADSLEKELRELTDLSSDCSIYRVARHIRQRNEKAYTPKAVSIGPLHHGREELQAMEEYKKRYLKDFLQERHVSLQDIIELVRKRETEVRNIYAETIVMDSDEFVKMILLDSVFIIEILTRSSNRGEISHGTDRIFGKQKLISDVWMDFWLVENQLPFFIIENILDMLETKSSNPIKKPLGELVYTFLKMNMKLNPLLVQVLRNSEALHFVDSLRNYRIETQRTQRPRCRSADINDSPRHIRSATELYQAGVKFRKASSKHLFDIKFIDGILEIPRLRLGNQSDVLYGNLIVFEQCHYDDCRINDYFFLMAQLIKSNKDVDLLVKKQILRSLLGSNEEVAKLINDLEKIVTPQDKFYFSNICQKLTKYYKNPCNKWRATLRQDYFYNPWAAVSVAGAVLLLILTFLQTVFTIKNK